MGKKGIPRQNRRRLPIDHMIGRPAPTQIVVVHGGKIVMNKGIGMHKFEWQGQGKKGFSVSPHGLDGGQRQNRPDPFSSGQEAVSDPFGQTSVFTGKFPFEKGFKGLVHTFLLHIEVGRDFQPTCPFD